MRKQSNGNFDMQSDGFRGERSIVLPPHICNLLEENEFTKGLHVTRIGYYPCAKNHFKERDEGLPENILIFCDEGFGKIVIDGEVHQLKKNRLFIIPSNVGHMYMADKQYPWSIFWIHFKGSNINLFESLINRIIIEEERLADREILFEEIYQTLEMGYSQNNLEYCTSCLHYLLSSFKYPRQYAKIKSLQKNDVIDKVISYMKEDLGRKLTINDLSAYVNFSPSYVAELFHRKTGMSPIDYQSNLRIQKACFYLQYTDMSIKEIANSLGYFDQFHFSKVFTKRMQLSPFKYKNLHREIE